MTVKMFELKNLLKAKAVEIRKTKLQIKEKQRAGNVTASILQSSLISLRHWYRHHHIAYSLLRAKTYEQIEKHVAENNKPDMDLVERIKHEYVQDVCACAA